MDEILGMRPERDWELILGMRSERAHLVSLVLQQFLPLSLSDTLVVDPCELNDAVHTGCPPG